MRAHVVAGAVAASLAMLAARPVQADAPAIAHLQYSSNIGANIVGPGQFAARRDFVDDDLVGTRLRQVIAGLPERVVLHDFHIEPNNNVLLTLDVGVLLDGNYYSPGDVLRFHGSSFSKEFDAVAAGVPRGVRCDGVARLGRNGPLLLSFDRTFTVGGVTIRPADVITFSGGGFGAKVLDAQFRGLADELNVDAIDTMGTNDYLLVSFDSGGTLYGIPFADEDVIQVYRGENSWTKRFALHVFSDRWDAANLDGLATTNNDTIFQDSLE